MTKPAPDATHDRDSARWLRLGLSLAVALFGIILVGWAIGTLLPRTGGTAAAWPADRSVLRFFVDHRRGWLTSLMEVLTFLGSSSVLLPLVAIVGLAWWRPPGTGNPRPCSSAPLAAPTSCPVP